MTELQKTQWSILCEFIRICDQLELSYFLVCGSALGAVKYRGFIPWDDDLDVGMCRRDYEVFLKNASELLPEHLFLQNYQTDPAFPQIYSKLRNSNTTFIEKSSANLQIHHGIYIDIFPLDGYPEAASEQRRLERKKQRYKRQLACAFDVERNWKSKLPYLWNRMTGCHRRTAEIAERYEKLVSQYASENSHLLCNHGNWQGKLEYAPKEHYGGGAWAEFEGLRVRIPAQYDAYLTQKYGDWRTDPPREEQIGHHFYEICDCSRPFTDYVRHSGSINRYMQRN